jgi:hypothetical protein
LNYRRSAAFLDTMAVLGIAHVPIAPSHPRANGKVGRFNPMMLEEWVYVRLYRSNGERLRALRPWVSLYMIADLTRRWEAAHRSHACEQRRWELQLGREQVSSDLTHRPAPAQRHRRVELVV